MKASAWSMPEYWTLKSLIYMRVQTRDLDNNYFGPDKLCPELLQSAQLQKQVLERTIRDAEELRRFRPAAFHGGFPETKKPPDLCEPPGVIRQRQRCL